MSDPLDQWPSSRELAELFPAAFVPNVRPKRPDIIDPVSRFRNIRTHDPNRPLRTRVRMILSLELRGQSYTEIADKMGLRYSSIMRIVRTDRYIAAREVLLGRMDAEFSAMKPAVFNALRTAIDSRDENTALRASEAWMKAAGFGQYGKGNAQQGITAEDVARQLLQVNVNVNVNKDD